MRTRPDNTRHRGAQSLRSQHHLLHRPLPVLLRLCGVFFVIALILALASAAFAQGTGVRIENISALQVETEPGQIVSATFRIWNDTDAEREFLMSAELPDSWSLVTPLFPFTLKPDEEKFLFLAVALPKYELAGSYTIRAKVADTSFAGIADETVLNVTVIPVAKVEVRAPMGEYRVLAGDEYSRTFTVINRSNAPSRFAVSVTSSRWEKPVAEPSAFSLQPGSSQAVTVTVQTPEDIAREEKHRVTVTARSLDLNHGTVSASASVVTTVFPRELTGTTYETLDGTGSLLFGWEDDAELAAQFKVDLNSELGEGRWGRLYYVGPYRSSWRGQRFLQEDRILLQYGEDARGYISVGDDSLEITPLTERYFYGRGVDLEVRNEPMAFRVFASKRRSGWKPENLLGAQLSVEAPGNTEVTLTALRKQETHAPAYLARGKQEGSIVSLSAKSSPAEGVELEGEYGWGNVDDGKGGGSKSDNAYRLAARIERERIHFEGELARAGTSFPGYLQDAKLSRAYLSVYAAPRVRLWGSMSESKWNLAGDPLRARPENSFRTLGVSLPAGPLGTASIYRRWNRREDTNLLLWNESDRTTNFQLSRSFGNFSLTGTAEFGKRRNLLTGTDRDLDRYRLMFNARPGRNTTLSGGYSWDEEDTALGGQRLKSNQLWLNADVKLSDRTELSTSFNRSGGAGRPSYNWVRADLKHSLGSGRSLRIRIQRRGGALGKEFAAALEFTFPLSVPVKWLPKSGRLEGRVYLNEGRNEPLADVVVFVDGMEVATDKNGRFVFPSLPAGEYVLRIDRGTLGLDQIPDLDAPFAFTVKPGETVKLDIPVVPSASISGRVTAPIQANDSDATHSVTLKSLGKRNGNGNHNGHANHNGDNVNDGYTRVGVSGVLVALESGAERLVRITGPDGEFNFEGLRPGRWKLTLVEGQLPKHYELTPQEVALDIVPGQTEDGIEFIISPVARPMVITSSEGSAG